MNIEIKSEKVLADSTQTGVHNGSEWYWKPSDLPIVFEKAKELKIASIGGNAILLLPNGTYELYWISIDPKEQANNETWEEYVIRSNDESLALLANQTQTIDIRKESPKELTLDKGIDPQNYLFYVFYFNNEQESLALEKLSKDTGMDQHIQNPKK